MSTETLSREFIADKRNQHRLKIRNGLFFLIASLIILAYGSYFIVMNVDLCFKTSCTSSIPCDAYKDVFRHYYFVQSENTGYLIGRNSYLSKIRNVVYVTNSSVVQVGSSMTILNLQQLHIPLDGSTGKVDRINADLTITGNTLQFKTIRGVSISVN